MQSALPKRFGDFQFDSRARQIRKRGHTIRLHGQPLEILGLLLERPGEVVLREELRAKLWPEDTFVDFEHSLNAAVNKLREALDDDANNPRFIETVPRRGYRFIAPVEGALPASAPDSTNLDAPAANQEAIDLGVEKSAAEVPMPSGARPRRRGVAPAIFRKTRSRWHSINRRAAARKSLARSRAGILRRRHDRGADHRISADQRAQGDFAHLRDAIQGNKEITAANCQGAACGRRGRRRRAALGRQSRNHGAVDPSADGPPSVGEVL